MKTKQLFKDQYLDDEPTTSKLKDWKKYIDRLIQEHGEDVELCLDAGYNNISMFLRTKVV